ncbi:hypothetical protein BDF21DRAFT_413186, partial [Thamnidium elegans]
MSTRILISTRTSIASNHITITKSYSWQIGIGVSWIVSRSSFDRSDKIIRADRDRMSTRVLISTRTSIASNHITITKSYSWQIGIGVSWIVSRSSFDRSDKIIRADRDRMSTRILISTRTSIASNHITITKSYSW